MTDPGPVDATALVTGGAGFIGAHLVDALVAENEVRVLDDFSTGTRDRVHPDAAVIEGDVRDADAVREAMRGVDVVFHMAAIVSVDRSVEDPVGSHDVNVEGSLRVLEAAQEAGARVVAASSAAVYGDPASVPIAEDDSVAPTSPYGLQKRSVEEYCRLYHDLHGVDAVPLRYFNAYGPGQTGEYSGVIGVFVRQALRGDLITVHGDGGQTRDFVHVDDVVRATLLAASADAAGPGPLNVATGESVTIRELAEVVRDVCGSTSEIMHVEAREGDIRASRADVTAARDALGFEAGVGLREGLESVVEWARGSDA